MLGKEFVLVVIVFVSIKFVVGIESYSVKVDGVVYDVEVGL